MGLLWRIRPTISGPMWYEDQMKLKNCTIRKFFRIIFSTVNNNYKKLKMYKFIFITYNNDEGGINHSKIIKANSYEGALKKLIKKDSIEFILYEYEINESVIELAFIESIDSCENGIVECTGEILGNIKNHDIDITVKNDKIFINIEDFSYQFHGQVEDTNKYTAMKFIRVDNKNETAPMYEN